MLDGGEGSQPADAVSQVFSLRPDTVACRDVDPAASTDFLAEHRGEIAFVTINIGSNDVFELGFEAGLVQIQQTCP